MINTIKNYNYWMSLFVNQTRMYMFREQVEDLQKEIQKIEADYRRQVVTVIAIVVRLVL